jgi:hypothetical protein
VPSLPHPLVNAYGLARFFFYRRPRNWLAHTLRVALMSFFTLVGVLHRMHFHPGAPVASAAPAGHGCKCGGGEEDEAAPQGREGGESSGFPVVLFSHGLGGYRSLYSMLCAELASQGYVVFAAEHSDGTASACRLAGGQVRARRGRQGGSPGPGSPADSVARLPTAGRFMRGPPRRAGSSTTAWAKRRVSWGAPGSALMSCAPRCAS